MLRQMNTYANPCVPSEQRDYVKLQYGRKIAQDTCMLASMKAPDWPQSPGFVGKQNSIPCTVTTNSSGSSLKMYPYSVYSSGCQSDPLRCQKLRTVCSRHRCFSGSAVQVLLPSTSPTDRESLGLPRGLVQSQLVESTNRGCLLQPMPLTNLLLQPSLAKLSPPRPTTHAQHPLTYHHHPHSQQQQSQPQHPSTSALHNLQRSYHNHQHHLNAKPVTGFHEHPTMHPSMHKIALQPYAVSLPHHQHLVHSPDMIPRR